MRRVLLLVPLAAAAAIVAAPQAKPDTAPILQARAQRVIAEVNALDRQIERVAEAYDRAGVELARTRRGLRTDAVALAAARRNLVRAQAARSRLLVVRYEAGDTDSTLGVLLGATSLDDLVGRLDAVQHLSEQDVNIVKRVKRFQHRIRSEQRHLRREQAAQRALLGELRSRKTQIEGRLADRKRLLASIRSEVARIQAQERARQSRLRGIAEARIARAQTTTAQAARIEVTAAAAAGPGHPEVVGIAMRYLGIRYQWGGASPATGFDCSGLVMYVYAQVGISLPHNAAMQYAYGVPVDRSALLPGDLVFFNGLGHDGIYIGGGQFIDAPKTGDVVKIENLNDGYWSAAYVGARRLP